MLVAATCCSLQLHPRTARQQPCWAAVGGRRHRQLTARRAPVTTVSRQGPAECSGSSSSAVSGDDDKGKRGPRTRTAEPQPQLQAWLQQEQGLSAADADQHARRLALVFGSQQAALDGLPATFEWCRSQGLSGPRAAQLLNRIAKRRRESVVQFAALVQPVWQLLDSHIAAYVEPLRQAGARLPKHTSLAGVLRGNEAAADALSMPPGHVEAWLAAVSEQMPAAAVGRLLLSLPNAVCGKPATAEAAISWAADVLGLAEPVDFFARVPALLKCEATTLQRNLDSLQRGLGWTAEAARQLALKQPVVLASSTDTVEAAAAWLRQRFPNAEQLANVIERGSRLLCCSEQHLRGNANHLRQALGWQDGDGQLAAFVAAHPQPFATVDLNDKQTQHKLRLLSEVVGVSAEECLGSGSSYLMYGLETMAAHYMLALERAPELLFKSNGEVHLSWIATVSQTRYRGRLGLSDRQYHAFVREWKDSEEGRRLLEGLRSGNVNGWPRPPLPGQAEQQQRAEAEQRRQEKAGRRTGTAAAMDGKRRGRRRGSKAEGGSSGANGAPSDDGAVEQE